HGREDDIAAVVQGRGAVVANRGTEGQLATGGRVETGVAAVFAPDRFAQAVEGDLIVVTTVAGDCYRCGGTDCQLVDLPHAGAVPLHPGDITLAGDARGFMGSEVGGELAAAAGVNLAGAVILAPNHFTLIADPADHEPVLVVADQLYRLPGYDSLDGIVVTTEGRVPEGFRPDQVSQVVDGRAVVVDTVISQLAANVGENLPVAVNVFGPDHFSEIVDGWFTLHVGAAGYRLGTDLCAAGGAVPADGESVAEAAGDALEAQGVGAVGSSGVAHLPRRRPVVGRKRVAGGIIEIHGKHVSGGGIVVCSDIDCLTGQEVEFEPVLAADRRVERSGEDAAQSYGSSLSLSVVAGVNVKAGGILPETVDLVAAAAHGREDDIAAVVQGRGAVVANRGTEGQLAAGSRVETAIKSAVVFAPDHFVQAVEGDLVMGMAVAGDCYRSGGANRKLVDLPHAG